MASSKGERLLPSLVDEIAHSDPHRILYSVAKTQNPQDGFEDIDAKTFARAVNRCSWYIEDKLGQGQGFPTLTYMGPQDVVYGILTLACIKTGYKLLLNSPRNTLEQHLYLFEKTGCTTFLAPVNYHLPVVKHILAARPMLHLDIPPMAYWLDDQLEGKHYPYTKTFAEAKGEPWVAFHTSGSTGFPKHITQNHGSISQHDLLMSLPSQGLQPAFPTMYAGKRVYLAFPLFHGAGLTMLLPFSIYIGFTIVLGPFHPSAEFANGVHVHGNVQETCLPPSTLVDLARDPEYLENLHKLDSITYAGGPLPKAIGDLVSTKNTLINAFGSTECSFLPTELCDAEDWAYLSFSPTIGHEYRRHAGDLYEMVIVRKPELEKYQGVFCTFPELSEWPMKDLYSKHPTKEDVWLYRGRADDIIVFSTGEKLNPLDMEHIISENPAVNSALMAGFGRFQSSLLVEAIKPPINEEERKELLQVIWPSVRQANKESPSHGRIHRDMIIFSSPEKPFLRAGKGTVQRQLTLDLYAAELESLYNTDEAPVHTAANGVSTCRISPEEAVKKIIATATDINIGEVSSSSDLFELGVDSLQVTMITKEINRYLVGLGVPRRARPRTVYSNPSIYSLTSVVSALLQGTGAENTETDEQKMKRIYELYAANMPISGRQAQSRSPGSSVVLLTGSTGSLGSYILDSLQRDRRVRQIYCLNRGLRSLERQQKSLATKGLQPLSERVQCFDADLKKSYFGLSRRQYQELLEQVTHVVHNAWQVDFNLSIDSFINQIGGVRRFIDFSAHSRFGAQIFFVSSLGAVGGRTTSVPEETFDDWHTPGKYGYAESKFVSERLLDTAAKEVGIPTIVCRAGQVAGPISKDSGMWQKQEWVPSLIASSKYLGKLPTSLGRMDMVDWIPVDVFGQGIVELAIQTPRIKRAGAAVYHMVNPQRTTWGKLLTAVGKNLSLEKDLPIKMVSLAEWVEALRKSVSQTVDLTQNPAGKILNFYEDLLSNDAAPILLNTDETLGVSKTLASLGPVNDAWMEKWMKQWRF